MSRGPNPKPPRRLARRVAKALTLLKATAQGGLGSGEGAGLCAVTTSRFATAPNDKQGWELQGLEQARELATRALLEMAKNTLPGALAHEMVIEVNEDGKEPALRVTLRLEVERLA